MDTSLNIAVIEDNDDLRELLALDIRRAGHFVTAIDCAEALDSLMTAQSFELLVLDVNLPGENGYSIAKRYKAAHPHIFIVMVTARGHLVDKVTGYESGADIYLTKPVSSAELTSAIANISRRIRPTSQKLEVYLNIKKMTLSATHTVDLNKREVDILQALATSLGGNLPYYRLLEICGEEISDSTKAALEVRIVRLRKKFIEIGINDRAIRALRGDGYQLLLPIRTA